MGKTSRTAALGALLCFVTFWCRPGQACGWEYETYFAEANALPCVFDVLVGHFQPHTEEYHHKRIEAFDYALAWAPHWTDGLDVKGLAHMRLGEHDRAKEALERRHRAAPDAYASHANLGTLYTFTGELDAALKHVDRAMKIEPKAHFGREGYHRKLVVFLKEVAEDPDVAKKRDFLGLNLESAQRNAGNADRFKAAGATPDAFDALVSMIAVYGAEDMAELYLALGELLSLRGRPRLAWTAYTRAIEMGHPRKKELQQWAGFLQSALLSAGSQRTRRHGEELGFLGPRPGGAMRPIFVTYEVEREKAKRARKAYADWERQQLEEGLAVWKDEGLRKVYERMNAQRRRCKAPSVMDDPLAPTLGEDDDAAKAKPDAPTP